MTRKPSGSGVSWPNWETAGLVVLADKGYQGSSYAKLPYRGRNKPESPKAANRAHAKLRAPGERANALLKNWRSPPQAPLLSLACRATPRRSTLSEIHAA